MPTLRNGHDAENGTRHRDGDDQASGVMGHHPTGHGSVGHTAAGSDDHEGSDHGKHAGHSVAMFRRRFWWSLLLTVPLVVTSDMVMEWFGYSLSFRGMSVLGPTLGSIVFLWGGWPFLQGCGGSGCPGRR